MARPTKLFKETVQKLEDAFILGASIKEACFNANITKQTYYNWTAKNPELLDHFEALQQSPILKARKAVVEGLDGNPEFALKYLERKLKNEFGLHSKEVSDGTQIRIVLGETEESGL